METNKSNNNLINYLLRNNTEGVESLKNSQNKNINEKNMSVNSITKSRLNELDLSNNEFSCNNNYKFMKKKDFLFLWFINIGYDLDEIFNYFNSFFEPLCVKKILKEQFNCDEISFKDNLEDIFGHKK